MPLILKVQELTNNKDFKLRLVRVKLPLLLDENLVYCEILNRRLSENFFSILISFEFVKSLQFIKYIATEQR